MPIKEFFSETCTINLINELILLNMTYIYLVHIVYATFSDNLSQE